MPALVFDEDVSEQSLRSALQWLQMPSFRQGGLLVNSSGGDPAAVMKLASSIRAGNITTICDHAGSAAVYLYALGERRLAHADSTFFFHQMTKYGGENDEWLTLGELRSRQWLAAQVGSPMATQYQLDIELLYSVRVATLDFLVATTDTDRGTFINLMENEVTLSAKEALHLNLVQEVVSEEQVMDMLGLL